ncbi:MAG: ATP-grasp domain-containing protein [Treponemataceae bacterium]|nr:ATP-grasp domain-containing protein [Treponemataceae bacterium]
MRLVFFNTNSNHFDPKIVHIKTMPSWNEEWSRVAKNFSNHEFFLAAMLPAMFLLDYENEAIQKAANVNCVELRGASAEEIAEEILALNPDVAVAASFWITPYDWLGLQDAMIAEILRERGVRTVAHSAQTQAICFDKFKTHIFLRENNFKCAAAVHVNYDLFWAERKKSEVRQNVYREFIFREISKLNFPVIIKATTGVSSYGMEVVHTLSAVRAYLNSKKFNSDRLIEEFLEGIQFGTEIHTVKNSDGSFSPKVFPPLMYSVNQYGITSPKQSVKLGPLNLEKFKTQDLSRELERLAKILQFEGIAQIDLVFHKNEWHIIEINPRLSGSSAAIALIKQKSLPQILAEFALGIYDARATDDTMKISKNFCDENCEEISKEKFPAQISSENSRTEFPLYLNIKFPHLSEEQMRALFALPFVKYLCQTKNDAARQFREMGFCEILFGGVFSPQELLAQLEEIKTRFPEVIEISFYETAKKMIASLI